jgi:hypothetical protein
MAVTKQQLAERKDRKVKTFVRWSGQPADSSLERPLYVVKDLFDREGFADYIDAGRVAIGPDDIGIAWGVSLDDISLD